MEKARYGIMIAYNAGSIEKGKSINCILYFWFDRIEAIVAKPKLAISALIGKSQEIFGKKLIETENNIKNIIP